MGIIKRNKLLIKDDKFLKEQGYELFFHIEKQNDKKKNKQKLKERKKLKKAILA